MEKIIDERLAIFFLMQFNLFARFEEIAGFTKDNLKFLQNGHLEVTFLQTKKYSVFDAQKSYFSRGGENFEPVSMIKS